MSGVENNKDNKKQKSLRRTPSGLKLARSPRSKLKKEKSNLTISEQQRSDLLSMDCSELDKDTKEEKTISVRLSRSMSRSNLKIKLPPPEAPPTHFVPVVVQGVWSDFLNYSVLNRNLVFTKVGLPFMTKLMPGDQISSINGIQFWNRDTLTTYLEGFNKNLKDPALMTVTVIRVWNMSCLTGEQINKLVAPRDEQLHYFSVKVWGVTEHEKGWKLVMDKKRRILVQHIHANTPISSALLIGDQILGVNDNFFTAKSKRNLRQRVLDAIKSSCEAKGYAEIIGCRLVGARSSPAASLEAELAKKYPGYAIGVDKGIFCKGKRPEGVNFPLESDALEIAFRELSFLKQWEKRDENGNIIDFELPPCDRGPGLLVDAPPSPGQPAPDSAPSTPSSTTLSRTASSTSMNEKTEKSTGSLYMPLTSSETPVAETPRKRKKFGKQPVEPDMPQDIKFEDAKNETSKITSDIPEEDELKKCDARSGIVAYIKNKWSGH
ncbi:unnamed protein product [Caenorhabditis brenneri]